MTHNLTSQSPVSDISVLSDTHNPFNLTDEIRLDLSTVFCTAFWSHKRDYIDRNKDLKEHLAKEDRDEKHDEVLISLCDFSERFMRDVAKTYKDLTGSDFWMKALEEVIAEHKQSA